MSLTFLILGILTAYFGSGKSRGAGVALLIVGIIIPIILYFVEWRHAPGYFMNNLFLPGLIYIGAGLIGVIIGFLVFLGIIMKT
ncbi:MAG: hypothetical protein GXO25_00865 [Euryarchaeota archaeon]|nr:hypothetical protein [Euryarchaeota archaeon]